MLVDRTVAQLLGGQLDAFQRAVDQCFPAHAPVRPAKAKPSLGTSASAFYRFRKLSRAERKGMLLQCEAIRGQLHSLGAGQRTRRQELIADYQACRRAIRESSAIRIQAVWRGYQARRPVKSARDPAHARLALAQTAIQKQRKSYGRPNDVRAMNLEQLQDDKAYMKRLLNGFDRAFRQKYKRLPTKQEKEMYRPIYEEYRIVKDLIARAEADATPSALAELGIKRLRNEKRALQVRLNKYEKTFRRLNGRKIQYQKDIAPVKADYERYMALKAQLSQMSSAPQTPTRPLRHLQGDAKSPVRKVGVALATASPNALPSPVRPQNLDPSK